MSILKETNYKYLNKASSGFCKVLKIRKIFALQPSEKLQGCNFENDVRSFNFDILNTFLLFVSAQTVSRWVSEIKHLDPSLANVIRKYNIKKAKKG